MKSFHYLWFDYHLFYFVALWHTAQVVLQFTTVKYSIWLKTDSEKTEPIFICVTNFSGLTTHRKKLFSLIIEVKVPSVKAEYHNFLKVKFSEIPKIRNF